MDDIRSTVKILQSENRLIEWSFSRTQKAFACREMAFIYRLVASRKDVQATAFCLRICTNLAHLRTLTESFTCTSCPRRPEASVLHLLRCPHERDAREALRIAVVERLKLKTSVTPRWHSRICARSDVLNSLDFPSLLRKLFETNASTDPTEVRFMIGAWSPSEQEQAARLTGITDEIFFKELALFLFDNVVNLCKRHGPFFS